MKITKQKYCESIMSKLSDGKLIPRFFCVENTYTESGYHVQSAYLILKNIKGVIELELKKCEYSISAVKRIIDLIAVDTGDKYIKLASKGILDPDGLLELVNYWDEGCNQINIQYKDGSHIWTDSGIDLGKSDFKLSRLNSTMIFIDQPNVGTYLTKEAFDNYNVYVDLGTQSVYDANTKLYINVAILEINFFRKDKLEHDGCDFTIKIYEDGSGFAKNKDNLNFILTKYKSEIDEALNKKINAFKKMTSIEESTK